MTYTDHYRGETNWNAHTTATGAVVSPIETGNRPAGSRVLLETIILTAGAAAAARVVFRWSNDGTGAIAAEVSVLQGETLAISRIKMEGPLGTNLHATITGAGASLHTEGRHILTR